MTAYIEHAAYRVTNIDWYISFFETVFEMDISKQRIGPDGARQIWLDGGIQLCEDKALIAADGRADHLCLITADLEAARTKALDLGCTPMPKHHWVMLPDGLKLELFQAAEGAVEALSAITKRA